MKMHCLGTGGYHPSRRRHTSCFFLPDWGLLLDAGTGIFRLPPLVTTDRLDVVLSHAHLDHTFGLTVLLDIQFQRPFESIHVWANAEKMAAIREHLLHPALFPAELPVQWHPIAQEQPWDLPQVELTSFAQDHPGGSLAFRASDRSGKSVVYATDTVGDTSNAFAQWADQPDVLIHECNFRDDQSEFAQRTGHTHTSRLIEVVKQAAPKSLVITHFNPLDDSDDPIDIESIRNATNLPVTIAEDDLAVSL